jgi:hypothetical protein
MVGTESQVAAQPTSSPRFTVNCGECVWVIIGWGAVVVVLLWLSPFRGRLAHRAGRASFFCTRFTRTLLVL